MDGYHISKSYAATATIIFTCNAFTLTQVAQIRKFNIKDL